MNNSMRQIFPLKEESAIYKAVLQVRLKIERLADYTGM
jgi:hypothetical protein